MNSVPAVSEVEPACGSYARFLVDNLRNSLLLRSISTQDLNIRNYT